MKIIFGKDQQPGTRTSLISDGVFHAELSLRGRKEPLPFSMVVDMNRELRPPVSAADLFENSFEFLKSRPGQDAKSMLLELARKIIQFSHAQGLGSLLSFSLTMIEGPLLHMLSYGGRTRLYLVRRGKAEQVAAAAVSRNVGVAGQLTNSDVETGYSSLTLQVGDKVILCTDGLYSMVSGTEELAVVERYDNPTFSAKHLTSIAMGRNVEENASAGVINYGKRLTLKTSPALIGGGIAIIALFAIGLALLLRQPQALQLPEDLGLAVHVSGQLYQVNPADGSASLLEDYAVINPGTRLAVNAADPVHLKLKRRVLATTTTENVPGVDAFLAGDSDVVLTSLDYARLIDGEPAPAALLDQTTIELRSGSILIQNEDSTRKYTILMTGADGENAMTFTLAQPNVDRGMIGVTRSGDQAEVYCLAGTCLLSMGEETVPVAEGSKVAFNLGELQFDALTTAGISAEELGFWSSLGAE